MKAQEKENGTSLIPCLNFGDLGIKGGRKIKENETLFKSNSKGETSNKKTLIETTNEDSTRICTMH